MHNRVWYHAEPGDPELERQIDAADWIMVERGINDPNIVGGWFWDWRGVPRGLENLLHFIDYVHERGRGVVNYFRTYEPAPDDWGPSLDPRLRELEYGLGGWLLTSQGRDLLGATAYNTPDNWWPGFEVALGAALGPRCVDASGVLRRDFEKGIVLLNGPDARLTTVPLGASLYTMEGNLVSEVRLRARGSSCSATAPTGPLSEVLGSSRNAVPGDIAAEGPARPRRTAPAATPVKASGSSWRTPDSRLETMSFISAMSHLNFDLPRTSLQPSIEFRAGRSN